MIKSIFKETFIMFLLCISIVLILGIIFYEYIPINKVVPNKVSYEVPESIKTELESNIELQEMQEQTIKYSVSAQDLKEYEQSGDYVKGNPNPFKLYNVIGNTTIIEGSSSTTSGNNASTHYYPTNTSTK